MPTFYCLYFNAFNSKTFSHLSTSCRTAPARHVTSGRAHAHAHAPPVRPRRAAPRHAMPRHAHAHALALDRLGEASERALARVWFTDLLLPSSQVVYTRSTL